jgi:hypothetical protein
MDHNAPTETKLFTRKDYLAGDCTYRQYYGQIVRLAGIRLSKQDKLVKDCTPSNQRTVDEHYNHIGLPTWDTYSGSARRGISKAFKQCGDSWSLAGGICVIKEAVRQAVEREEETKK